MTNETKEWDDEEETIINFTPKPRPSQSRVPEQAPAPASNDLLGLGLHASPAYKEVPDDERSSRGVVYEDSENSVLQEPLQPLSEASSPPTLPRIPPMTPPLDARAAPPPVTPPIEAQVTPPPVMPPPLPPLQSTAAPPSVPPLESRAAPPVMPPTLPPLDLGITPPPIMPSAETGGTSPPPVVVPLEARITPSTEPRTPPSLPPLPPPLPPLPTNLAQKKSPAENAAPNIQLPEAPVQSPSLWQNPPERSPLPEREAPGEPPPIPAALKESPGLPGPLREAVSEPVPQPPAPQTPPRIMLKPNPAQQAPAPQDGLPGFTPLPGFAPSPNSAPPQSQPQTPPVLPDLRTPEWEAPKRDMPPPMAAPTQEEPPPLDDIDPPTVIDVPAAIQRDLQRQRESAQPPPAETKQEARDTNHGQPDPTKPPLAFLPEPALPPEVDSVRPPTVEPIFPPPPVTPPAILENRAPQQPEHKPEPPRERPDESRPQKREESEEDPEKTNIYIPQRTTDEVEEVAWVVLMKTPSVRLHQLFRLDSARMEIGRSYDTPIFLDDRTVSMRHAAIRYERVGDKNEFVLYDLASTNGTYLNDTSVHMAVLKDDDRIRVGETEMAFKKVGDPATERP